ncbi:MAG: hypothetical protein K8H86_15415, partial [Ignavibacteriaceae bacterium]|nr:hypothetical protein [Ignavibacteriaceae bacterium]
EHPIKNMLNNGIKATLNSDDPAYFGGYLNDNFLQTAEAVTLTHDDIFTLIKNSFEASFVDDNRKMEMFTLLEAFHNNINKADG